MADLFKKNAPAEEATPVVADANAEAPAPEAKGKKEKKSKVKFLEPNQMNFLEQYSIVVEGKKKNLDLQKILKPLIAVLIVVLAIFVLLEVVLIGMKAQNKSLNKYVNDESNVASYNEALAVKDKIGLVNSQKANLESLMAAIDSYPNVDEEFFAAISNTATNNGVKVINYGYANATGYLTLTCTANSTPGISQFVRDLEKLGLFDSVTYTGFAGTDEGGNNFSISAVCLGDKNAASVEVDENAAAEEAPAEEVTEG